MQLSVVNILSIVILFQLALLILFLFSVQRGKRVSNHILCFFFFLLLLNLIDGLLSYYGFYENYPRLAHFEDGFVFLLGPVLLFYTRSIIYERMVWKKKDWLHALPFIVITTVYQIFYQLQTEEYQKMVQQAVKDQDLPVAFYLSVVIIYMHVGLYLFLSFRQLSFYRSQIRNRFSSLSNVNLNWLSYLLICFTAVLVGSLILTFLPVFGYGEYFAIGLSVTIVLVFAFVSGVLWKALRQPQLFAGLDPIELRSPNSISAEETRNIRQKLSHAMNVDEVFLDSELSIDTLSGKVGVGSRKLSQYINETCGQNFFEFVNKRRIEKAKEIFRTSTDPKLTVLEVMYQSGFNSKSSFNTIFKTATGMTPSEYKKRATADRTA